MTYEEFKKNFLPEFLNIKSFAGKIKYASQHLTRIGAGSGRIVYDIDGERVLKLAKNARGLAQNEAEASAGYYEQNHGILAKIYDSPEDESWLISEKAKPVNEARIIQLTGIPSLNELFSFLRNYEEISKGRKKIIPQNPEVEKAMWENEFAYAVGDFVASYAQNAGDMGRPSSYGEVIRNGKPAIVLTDYGLSDEVFDTHYSGKKPKYRMYEMYGFADGNDDMLSDMPPQDAIDTRQSMWALMPDGVGDGDSVINEKFINFVENRSKYPANTLKSTPYILDEFHNIVNNLTEVLNYVNDKKKFYNNLLELQDYLIRGKFYDREPLEKESLNISEATAKGLSDFSRDYADSSAVEIAEKLNLGTPQHLGEGGNGHAYLVDNNKVLKLTHDACEVDAGAKINSAHPKTLAYVYKIYKVVDSRTSKSFFVLIQDYIAEKPHKEFQRYSHVIESLGEDLYGRLLGILVRGRPRKDDVDFAGKTLQDFPELAKLILTANPSANITRSDREKAHQFMMGLYDIKSELQHLQIKSNDFITLSNLGYKNGILTYYDIGGCFVPEPNMSDNQTISLPEANVMNEEVQGLPRNFADRIANSVAQKYGYGQPKFIGEGSYGAAYDIGNNLVLKITKDVSEANENLALIGKPLKYIAQPYKVFSIKSPSADRDLYVIVLEKLKTDKSKFIAIVDRMNFAFEKIMGVKLGDVLDYYLHGFANGVDINKVQKYMARNPQDAEYFYGLLKIQEEAIKYGVESMDYVNPANLGYKPDGSLGFFDVGFGNYFFKAENRPEEVHIDEDLEYNHVVGDATTDVFEISERVNPIVETVTVDFPSGDIPGYGTYKIINDGQEVGEFGIIDRGIQGGNHYIAVDKVFIDKNFRGNNYANDAMRLLFDYADKNNIIITLTPDNVWGASVAKLTKWYKSLGFVMNKGRNKDFQTMQLMYRLPKNLMTEEIDAKTVAGDDDKALKYLIDGKRDTCFIEITPEKYKLIEKNGLKIHPVRMKSQNSMMGIVYSDEVKGLKLYNFAKSRGGYLQDKTPDEAREVGKLLGYMDVSIEEYIRKKYGKPVPTLPSPEDYNDLDETAGELDKFYVKAGIYDEEDRSVIMSITNGDNFTKLIADMYYYLTNRYNKEMVTPTRLSDRDKVLLVKAHNRLKTYDKNVLPIHDLYAKEHNAHPLEKMNDLDWRELIIVRLKQLPSILVRNVRADIRKERNHYEIEALFHTVKEIQNSLKLMGQVKPENREKIEKKIFSSANDTFEAVKKRLEDTTIPYLSQDEPIEGIIEKVNDLNGEAEILYNKDNILVVRINSGEAMGYIGCSSQWCFASNPQQYWDNYTGSEGYATIVFNFNEPESEAERMLVVLEDGEVYNMYNEYIEDGQLLLANLGVQEYVSQSSYENVDENLDVTRLDRGVDKDEMVEVQNFPLKNLTVSKRGIFAAIQDIRNNEPSRTNEPVLVFYNISNKTFLVEDGYHRVAQAYLDKQTTIPVQIYSNTWSDYVANISPENKFKLSEFSKKNNIFVENKLMNEANIMSLQDLPFKQEIEGLGGEIYAVGGSVRDSFLGKESKDLDIIVRNIPEAQLVDVLKKYGTVNPVGKSFAVMKFKPNGSTEDIDIALPRTEVSTGEGHKDFVITADPMLPIEKDLERRDFTINAIAKDMDGNVIDPFNGQGDLNSKLIRITHPKSFSDDPLRMLRAVQFASRFGFKIEPETYQMIRDNADKIRTVAKDRIQEEFLKIIEKGDPSTGAFLLKDTGLLRQMGVDAPMLVGDAWKNVRTLAEFVYLLTSGSNVSPLDFYKRNLRGDVDVINEIQGLLAGFENQTDNPIANRAIANAMVIKSKGTNVLQSKILPQSLQIACQELLSGKYPQTVNDLAATGNDLMAIGYKEGKELGDMRKNMLLKVYADKVKNNKEDLLALAGQNNAGALKEEKKPEDKIEYGCLMIFLDVPIWSKITSVIHPEDIYDEPGYGIETEPHVTILYGFHDEVTSEDCFALFKENMPLEPIKIGLKGISIFDKGPLFEVVKFDVHSDELTKLNGIMRQLPHDDKFPDYHPHITLAYVKKGEGSKYIKEFEKERKLVGNELVYSFKGHKGNDGHRLMLDGSVDEGVADKYAEKAFNIPDTTADQNLRANAEVLKAEEKPIAIMKKGGVPIFENPRSLTNFGPNTRAIVDVDGNIFVAQKNGQFNHGNLAMALGISDFEDGVYSREFMEDYQLLVRVGNSNQFGLSDASEDFAQNSHDYESIDVVKFILSQAKKRNPQYDFIPRYFQDVNKPEETNVEAVYEFSYPETSDLKTSTWNINGEQVGINYFVDKYYEWNQDRYSDPSDRSVREFIANNYEEFINDSKLNKELYWALTDNDILDEEEQMNRKVLYTAVVLDNKSRAALLQRLGNMIPEGWETIAHHMTINLGPIAPEFSKFLGMTVDIEAVDFSMDDKVMAVGVQGFVTKNAKPHVTLAVNRANGGKPMMSNKLTEWQTLSAPIKLTGKVTEVE